MASRRSASVFDAGRAAAREQEAQAERERQARYDARFAWDHYAERVHAMACAVVQHGDEPDEMARRARAYVDAVDCDIERARGVRP